MKKAVMMNWVQILIIALISLVVMLFFVSSLSQFMERTAEKDSCKASVLKHVVGRMRILDIVTDLNCPSKDITIKGRDAKEQLAQAMYDCFDKFGFGKLNMFNYDGVYCIICSRLDIRADAELDNFAEYLDMRKVPGKDYTYGHALQGYTTEKAPESIGAFDIKTVEPSFSFDSTKRYAVLFVYARGDEYIKKFLKASVDTAGLPIMIFGGVMIAVGAATSHFGVGIPFLLSGTKLVVAGVGVTAAGGIESFYESKVRMENPEHIAGIALREYHPEDLANLGCQYIPAKQK